MLWKLNAFKAKRRYLFLFLSQKYYIPKDTITLILENEKLLKRKLKNKRMYNQRVIEIEQGTFTHLVFGTNGAMAKECQIFHKFFNKETINKTKRKILQNDVNAENTNLFQSSSFYVDMY